MFSPTTIASSTTIPSTTMKAKSEIMFTDAPKKGIRKSAPRNEVGIPQATQNATRTSRKRLRQSTTRISPICALRHSRSMRWA